MAGKGYVTRYYEAICRHRGRLWLTLEREPTSEGSMMASEEDRRELVAKVTALVSTRYGGDYRAAFGHYDANGDGAVSADELQALLADAGVGSGWTRWAWAAGVMAELDTNGDGVIAWEEFEAVFRGGTP